MRGHRPGGRRPGRVRAKVVNAGQVCTSPSRFLADRRILAEFTGAFVDAMRAVRVGNGLDEGVRMGPMVSERRRSACTG